MKRILYLFCLLVFHLSAAEIQIKEYCTPILRGNEDNVLCYLKVDNLPGDTLRQIELQFDASTNLREIAEIKLFYGGGEVQGKRVHQFLPIDSYLNRNDGNYAQKANPSYSILLDRIGGKIDPINRFQVDQPLLPGVNYFWISVRLKKNASLLSSLSAKVTNVNCKNRQPIIVYKSEPMIRRYALAVRHAGDNGVNSYRIPGLVQTKKETLLGVYDIRYNSSRDLQEDIDVGLSRSTDLGDNWKGMQTILDMGTFGGVPQAQNGVGDPAILVDDQTGRIWVAALWTHGSGNLMVFPNARSGMEPHQTGQLLLTYSDNDGKSWSEPRNITSQVKHPSWLLLLQGPGKGITMEDGTLVFPIQFLDSLKMPHAGIMFSKDRGETWNISNPAHANTTEAQVVELQPGRLMLNMRDNRGGSRSVFVTDDLGYTWCEHSTSRKALQESVCMASIIKIKAEDNCLNQDLLFFSNPNTIKGRDRLTIKASLDMGETWLTEHQLLLDEQQGWGYSCLTRIDDETIGILYEGSNAHLVFQKIKIKEIVKSR